MSSSIAEGNQIIAELDDPFTGEKPVNQQYAAARHILSRLRRGVIRRLKPGVKPVSSPGDSLLILDFEKDAERPLHKKALLVYVKSGFQPEFEHSKMSMHSNVAQSLEIARAFNRLGYSVDVMDVYDSATVPERHYDIVFGEHYNFGRLLPALPEETLKVYYGTRSYWAAEHQAIERRAQRIKQTRGAVIPPKHVEEEHDWVEQSDAVIVIGNQVTADTYKPHHPLVYTIDNSALPLPAPDLESKDFAEAKNNFLWLGTGTLLRKGLDLVLEAFAGRPELHLWICTILESPAEMDFVRAYRRELFHTPNIHPIGMIHPQSETLKMLVHKCAALVFASSSEGMSGGVLDCMAHGLIPIISKETGIDTQDFGITLEQCSVEAIREALDNFTCLPPASYRRMAQAAYDQTQTRYTLDAFRTNIESLLTTVIAQRSKAGSG